MDLIYQDISDYQDFLFTLQESNKESEIHNSNKIYTQRLNRFIGKNRSLYCEFLERMKQEYKEGS